MSHNAHASCFRDIRTTAKDGKSVTGTRWRQKRLALSGSGSGAVGFIFFAQRLRSDTEGSGAARSCLCRLVGVILHLVVSHSKSAVCLSKSNTVTRIGILLTTISSIV